jgi:hypothetical protein
VIECVTSVVALRADGLNKPLNHADLVECQGSPTPRTVVQEMLSHQVTPWIHAARAEFEQFGDVRRPALERVLNETASSTPLASDSPAAGR